MEHPQSFSPGLLYSVEPEDLARLHLNDDSRLDGLDWDEGRTHPDNDLYTKTVLTFLKVTAAKWGFIRNTLN